MSLQAPVTPAGPPVPAPTVRALCARAGLSRQAFYQGERRRQRQAVDQAAVVARVRQERCLQPRLGGRKLRVLLAAALAALNIHLGRDRFFALLRQAGLLVEPRRPARPRTTDSRHRFGLYPNLVRHLEPAQPHQVWVADLTYIRTREGFLYLSLLTDAGSRQIVGWHASDTLEAEGCRQTLQMALAQLPAGARPIHHSDRGTQYCCHAYIEALERRELAISQTEVRHCYENALAERVNGILKVEYGLEAEFGSKALAGAAIKQAVALYNGRRPHQALGYRIPAMVHAQAA